MASSSLELRETYQAPGGAVAWTEGLVLIAWHGAPKVEQAQAIRQLGNDVRDASSTQVSTLAILEGGFPRFSDAVREEVNALVDETKDFSMGTALVLTQAGFTTAVLRTLLSGAALLARSDEPIAFFGAPLEGIEWLRGLYEGAAPWTQAEAARLVDRFMRARNVPLGVRP